MARASGYIVHDVPRGVTAGLVGDLPVAEAARVVEEGRLRLEDDRPAFSPDVHVLLAGLDVNSLTALHRLVERGRRVEPERLPIIGRELMLMRKLAKVLHGAAQRHHDYGPIRETRRGATFELHLRDGNEPTARVARVTVELDRVEPYPEGTSGAGDVTRGGP